MFLRSNILSGKPKYLYILILLCFISVICVAFSMTVSDDFFFFNDTATTEIYTLSLHDALPISTPEREQLRKTVRSFTEREILPHVDEWERTGDLPRDVHRRAGEAGLLGAGLPEAVGGGGGDGADAVLICEEFHQAGGPGGVFASLFTCGIAVPHMIASGDQRLIEEFVRPMLAGNKIGALAITEPGGGSDVGHLRTSAVRCSG